MWGRIKTAIEAPVAAVAGAVVNAFIWVRDALASSWNWITSIASSAWGAIKTAIWTPINWVGGAIVGAWEWVAGTLGGIWDGIKSVASTVWSGITGVIAGAINGVINVINGFMWTWDNVAQGWNNANGPLNFLDLPKFGEERRLEHVSFAKGGIVTRPTLAMLGDNPGHREAVIPLTGPNAAGIGGPTINLYNPSFPSVRDVPSFFDEMSRLAGRKTGLEKWVRG